MSDDKVFPWWGSLVIGVWAVAVFVVAVVQHRLDEPLTWVIIALMLAAAANEHVLYRRYRRG